MSAYVITDGYTIAKMRDSVFSHLDKTKGTLLFVNGLCFTSQNAATICKYIKEETKTTPIEVGMSIGTIKILSENQSVSDVYVDIEQENISDIKEILQKSFPYDSVHYLDFSDLKDTVGNKTKLSKKSEKRSKNIEEIKDTNISEGTMSEITSPEEDRPAFLRTLEEPPKKRGRRKKTEVDRVPESLEATDKGVFLLGGREEKNTEEEKDNIIYPETLEELKDFPYKKDGRITREGKIAFIHLKDKYGATEIGQFLGIPATTIAGIYFRYKSGKLDVTKEDIDRIFGENIENIDVEKESDANFDSADEDTVKAYIVKVPEKMKELMHYDRELVKDKSIDGRPLTGNIISDSELALGYKLSEADKSVLTNAFFSLTVYEEDFISNLKFGNFSHLKDAPKLRNVCDVYDKIRRTKAHGRKR